MEMALRAQSPLCSRSRPVLVVRPASAAAVPCLAQSIVKCSRFTRSRLVRCMVASSDYPKRNPRRSSAPKPKGTASRGYAPRPSAESWTSTKKTEHSSADEDGDLGTSNGTLSSDTAEQTSTAEEEYEVEFSGNVSSSVELKGVNEEEVDQKQPPALSSTSMDAESVNEATEHTSTADESSEVDFSGNVSSSVVLEVVDESETEEEADQKQSSASSTSMDVESIDRELEGYRVRISALVGASTQGQDQSIIGVHEQDKSVITSDEQDISAVDVPEQSQSVVGVTREDTTEQTTSEQDITEAVVEERASENLVARKHSSSEDGVGASKDANEEPLVAGDELRVTEDEEQHEPEMQEQVQMDVDPQALKRRLEELADKNYSIGNKCFVFPELVEADSVIDLYLNRSISALASEPDILIKGAFNGWRWNHFTEKLHRSELTGDWWCCKLYIPKQAYRLDFVFFNGDTVYENNSYNDFVLHIESDIDEHSFEDILLEEKQRELERLAAEEAERERQAEEERRKEEDRAAMEADRAQAKAEVEMTRNRLQHVLGLASRYADNLWYIQPSTYKGGDRVRLYYNRSSRSLKHKNEIWLHGGYNNWTDGPSIVERLVKSEEKDGDWWYANVTLPESALVLDWVFADGSPGNANKYDNNGKQDFHAAVSKRISDDLFWVEEERRIFERLQRERKEKEDAGRRKAEITARMKAEMKEKTMREFLLSQKHIVYTEPLEVRAGTTVDVLYNPSNTVLNGSPEVWFRCSFNRWTHPSGPLPPQKMVNAENGSHLQATVRVPLDAYMMDFVFSESEEGGIYDNRDGMDYHIPVSDSMAKEPPMHIVHIAVEMAPIAKVGGLGDVVTSLSRAIQDLGHKVEVIFPKYDCLNLSNVKDLHCRQSFTWGGTEIKVWFGKVEGISVYFLEPQNGMFWVGCVYGRNDESRFGFFCHSALEFLLQSGSSPDIIHCHDWSSAPVAWLYKQHYVHNGLPNGRVVFTIHNLEFGVNHIGKAMAHCDKATTVSYTYSKEVSGHGSIAPHYFKFHGIRNGIDSDIWDPYNDNFIPVHYTSENVVEGKSSAKRALQEKLGLHQTDTPLVGIISRLTAQKGIHLIKHAIYRTLERNGQVVLLGSAPDHRIQGDFSNLAAKLHGEFDGRVKLCLTYDEPLSHLIYAGADFILVPSIFEPCGLTQLTAMRYGSIPIVRKTGGLYDTVFDVDDDKDRAREQGLEPNGFSFEGADSNGVDYALDRAITTWYDARDWFHSLCKRVMEQDWSWNRPALDYMELYHSARKN
ncbi:starch synthase 3, chloroplastic/amyloplastic-like [Triticum dicoccoides]|uniref:starch synthase 3, chloroplastic/amyloplastic-like n=1 Tax=Triticum dicoccoides TaxID=85692 RepID=UPI00188EF834|nr:starch synthase 3, chloroplastic/amyloplastic-like [Triticum dicoccoides]